MCEPVNPPTNPLAPTTPTSLSQISNTWWPLSSTTTPASSSTCVTPGAWLVCQSWLPSTVATGMSRPRTASATIRAWWGSPWVVRSPASSLASWARGGPETRHDLDLMIRPEDVDRAVEALAAVGLRPEDPPEEWLVKAWDGDVLVDLIFAPKGMEMTDEVIGRGEVLS